MFLWGIVFDELSSAPLITPKGFESERERRRE